MKSNIIFFLLFFILNEIKYIINKKEKLIKEEKSIIEEKEELLNKEEENDIKESENEEEMSKPVMSDEIFEEKMYKILEKIKIKKEQKINKEILKKIFDEIYANEFNLPNLPRIDQSETDMDPKDESKHFKDEVFDKAARGLDYDDEIKISQIKEWIGPNRIRIALNEIIENLIGMVGDMGNMEDL